MLKGRAKFRRRSAATHNILTKLIGYPDKACCTDLLTSHKIRLDCISNSMKDGQIKPSEITDQKTYLNRRFFMRGAALAGSVAATGFLYRKLNPPPVEIPKGQKIEVIS